MRLYNTLTRREEAFAPSRGNEVRMYTCGLTVYARGHIGNFRTFVVAGRAAPRAEVSGRLPDAARDELHRRRRSHDPRVAEGGRAAARVHGSLHRGVPRGRRALGPRAGRREPARDRPGEHRRDGCDDPRARGAGPHLPQRWIDLLQDLDSLPDYGKLARLDHAGIKSGARVDADKYDKENARDFVLWKATKPGEPTWDPGIGPGRPGWHIECSAMALRLLGEPPIDIHAGGVDLIFPHHENEIAQSEGATGKQFSRFWVHVEHLMIEDEPGKTDKMSKSLGNVFNLQDIIDRGFRPSALRYLYLNVHYRKQLKFSWTAMAQAEEALKRLTDFLARLDRLPAATRQSADRARAAAGGANGVSASTSTPT